MAEHKQRVGQRIAEARGALGITQSELAQRLPGKVDGPSVSRWERGAVYPEQYLDALAEVLGVDVAFFLSPTPKTGTGDLMLAFAATGKAEPSQLDRIETLLGELLVRVQRLEDAIPSDAESFEEALGAGGQPPAQRDDDNEEDEPEDQAEGQ